MVEGAGPLPHLKEHPFAMSLPALCTLFTCTSAEMTLLLQKLCSGYLFIAYSSHLHSAVGVTMRDKSPFRRDYASLTTCGCLR